MAEIFRRMIRLAAVAILLIGSPARAGFLGQSIELFSVADSVDSLGFSLVGPGVEYQGFRDFIDVSDNSIRLGNKEQVCTGGCPTGGALGISGDFHGYRIIDHLNLIAPIIGVEIVSSTIAGFSAGDIVVTKNEIYFLFEQPNFYFAGDVIPEGEAVLNVTFLNIAEPATLALFCAGLAGLAASRRRLPPSAQRA